MGVVYEATDERLGRRVALKTIHPEATDPSAKDRLWREARAAASVNHPNVCQIYDVGEQDGEVWIAMELLDGEPLSARLAKGPMSPPEALQAALGMLGALEALHARGLRSVHVSELQPKRFQNGVKETRHSSISFLGADDVVAALQQSHDRVNGGHPRGEGQTQLSAFERGQIAFQRRSGGVARAGIFVPLMLSQFFLHVGGRLENGNHHRPGRGIGFLSLVNGIGCKTHSVFFSPR